MSIDQWFDQNIRKLDQTWEKLIRLCSSDYVLSSQLLLKVKLFWPFFASIEATPLLPLSHFAARWKDVFPLSRSHVPLPWFPSVSGVSALFPSSLCQRLNVTSDESCREGWNSSCSTVSNVCVTLFLLDNPLPRNPRQPDCGFCWSEELVFKTISMNHW